MKKIILTSLWTIVASYCSGQYIGRYTLDNKVKELTLLDKKAKVKFILDSAHIVITATTMDGKLLWKTDPWLDNKLEKYRVDRPTIVYYDFGKEKSPDNKETKKEVIWISYNNTQFGTVDKKTGKFIYHGQD
jgi:hypothetical protein